MFSSLKVNRKFIMAFIEDTSDDDQDIQITSVSKQKSVDIEIINEKNTTDDTDKPEASTSTTTNNDIATPKTNKNKPTLAKSTKRTVTEYAPEIENLCQTFKKTNFLFEVFTEESFSKKYSIDKINSLDLILVDPWDMISKVSKENYETLKAVICHTKDGKLLALPFLKCTVCAKYFKWYNNKNDKIRAISISTINGHACSKAKRPKINPNRLITSYCDANMGSDTRNLFAIDAIVEQNWGTTGTKSLRALRPKAENPYFLR